jgi:hypothetical protein
MQGPEQAMRWCYAVSVAGARSVSQPRATGNAESTAWELPQPLRPVRSLRTPPRRPRMQNDEVLMPQQGGESLQGAVDERVCA